MNSTTAGYQTRQWHVRDTKQRMFAASLAVLITLFLSRQFTHRSSIKSDLVFLNRPFTLLMFQTIPAERPKVEDQTSRKKSTTNKLSFIPVRVRVKQAEKANDSAPAISTEITPVQSIEQPVTLLPINSKTIAKAYNESKSEIQKMAEASGKELNTTTKTKFDRFQTAAEQAVIPDCLSPQGPGGIGLFAIPVIAFAAATGKCK